MMSPDEQEAMELLGDFHQKVFRDWKLNRGSNLEAEFCAALHVLQGFVIQHMLQRVAPEEFGAWYGDRPAEKTS